MNADLFRQNLYAWYSRKKRDLPWRETEDPYLIWVSEIILQQTRVEQGLGYYLRFTERFPTVESLAEAAEDEVLLYWQGLGYYSRARNIHKGARAIGRTENFPKTWEGLRSLPGVGDYTAGAIASFAYNQPYPAIDGNIQRVLARLYDSDVQPESSAGKRHFRELADELLDRTNPRLFNNAMMELGALQCLPQQLDCSTCPVKELCAAKAHGTAELLPVRKPKAAVRDRYLNYSIYLADGKTLLRQRTEKDIWQHLWEFPLEETLQPKDAEGHPFADFVHQLSHQRLHARFIIYKVPVLPEKKDTAEVNITDLDQFALSRLTLRALEKLKIQAIDMQRETNRKKTAQSGDTPVESAENHS